MYFYSMQIKKVHYLSGKEQKGKRLLKFLVCKEMLVKIKIKRFKGGLPKIAANYIMQIFYLSLLEKLEI